MDSIDAFRNEMRILHPNRSDPPRRMRKSTPHSSEPESTASSSDEIQVNSASAPEPAPAPAPVMSMLPSPFGETASSDRGVVADWNVPADDGDGVGVEAKVGGDDRVRKCWVLDGHMLVIKTSALPDAMIDTNISAGANEVATANIVDDVGNVFAYGRNARGTYSREFKDAHPEMGPWVHRGQGRYLPVGEVKKEALAPEKRSRHSRTLNEDTPDATIVKDELPDSSEAAITAPSVRTPATALRTGGGKAKKHFSDQARANIEAGLQAYWARKREEKAARQEGREVRKPAASTATAPGSAPPQYSLRHKAAEPDTPSALESRGTRLARKARPMDSIEGTSRSQRRKTYDETGSGDDYDEEYETPGPVDAAAMTAKGCVKRDIRDAHPNEEFYHTGNGWYRQGRRPSTTGKQTKTGSRASDRGTTTSQPPGHRRSQFDLAEDESVHKTDLHLYPGMEFHHKGNGWYKPGPDPKGIRASRWGGDGARPDDGEDDDEENEDDEAVEDDEEEEEEEERAGGATVSKEYALAHPNIEWVHRGNGRWLSKAEVEKDAVRRASDTPAASSTERRNSEQTFSKAYKEAHPELQWYHTGNARYKIGVRPVKAPAAPESEGDEDESHSNANSLRRTTTRESQTGSTKISLKRTTSRRTSRPSIIMAAPSESPSESEGEIDSDVDTTRLVDTQYVAAHPKITFHHKGQGRWAFGFPPPGSHNKTAIRGPGAKKARLSIAQQSAQRTVSHSSGRGREEDDEEEDEEEAEEMEEEEEEEEEDEDGAPGPMDLVFKHEGPDKFPHIVFHYRGGGKWGRLKKDEAERLVGPGQKISMGSRHTGHKRLKLSVREAGPEAQLARETKAAQRAEGNAVKAAARPKMKRARKSYRGHALEDGSKDVSGQQSKATTPPRILEPHEDVLTAYDLPDIFQPLRTPPPGLDPIDSELRMKHPALNADRIVAALTKHDPAVRRLEVLKAVAANAQRALDTLQTEYLALDAFTAPHAVKIPRKPAKGGRVPVDPQVFEDRKEADLYDYVFDGRKLGFQDPDGQKIVRDTEGRELRKRRQRNGGAEGVETVPGWYFGEGPGELAPKRQSRQPMRFDAQQEPPRKRMRISAVAGDGGAAAGSLTPDRGATPLGGGGQQGGYRVPTRGRWAGHESKAMLKAKRVEQLRGESVASTPGLGEGLQKEKRKGRPPGSKNLHKRRDAGIKKGPRKPKVVPNDEGSAGSGGGVGEYGEAAAGAAMGGS